METDVLIVGGGIAGLACASRLASRGIENMVLEADDCAGGNVRSDSISGFLIERGPHTFMPSADDIFDLAREAGLADAIVASHPAAKKRFIVRKGKMHKVFSGPLSFIGSRLLSLRGKFKLMGEPFRTRRRGDPSDNAATFFERRFGPEAARVLAGAFISGVYAGDPASLSAPAAFSLFWKFEQEHGSMIRGARHHREQRKAELEARGESEPRPEGLCSFEKGLGQLSATLAEGLADNLRTSTAVESVVARDGGFEARVGGQVFSARRLVLAVPPHVASRLVTELDTQMSATLANIPMAPMAVVHMGHGQACRQIPDGFGFLAPRGEGVRTLGVLFPSRLFAGRAPQGGDLLTGFVGGMLDQQALELSDSELESIVRSDLERLTGLGADPDLVLVRRYEAAIPQFTMGHLERMAAINDRLSRFPGLLLAGNYVRGVGMKDAVSSGFAAAEALAGSGSKEQGTRS